jgi:hypothetical protein
MPRDSTWCAECKYGPIGPYVDNCPMCGAPTRGGGGDRSSGGWPFPVGVTIGVIVIVCVAFWLHGRQLGWVAVTAAPACAAWWFAAHPHSPPLARWLGGLYLGLLAVAIWVASQPNILPGLDPPITSPEQLHQMIEEFMEIAQGSSASQLQMARRYKRLLPLLLGLFALAVVPPFFLVPPLLGRRRNLALVRMDAWVCVAGLVLWLGAVGAYGAFLLPGQVRSFQGPGRTPMPFVLPTPHRPALGPQQPDDSDEPEEPQKPGKDR